jgi:hypothetical protein
MEKRIEIEAAKMRRAKLLEEFERIGITQSKFAKLNDLSQPRMHLLLKMARRERD